MRIKMSFYNEVLLNTAFNLQSFLIKIVMSRNSQLYERHFRRLPPMTPISEEEGGAAHHHDTRQDRLPPPPPMESAHVGRHERPAQYDQYGVQDVESIVNSYLSLAEHVCGGGGGGPRLQVTRSTGQCPCCKDVNEINNKRRTVPLQAERPLLQTPLPIDYDPFLASTTPLPTIPMVSDSTFLQNPESEEVDTARGFLNYPSTASLWAYLRTVDDHGLSPESSGKLAEDVMDASSKYTEAMNKLDSMTQTKF